MTPGHDRLNNELDELANLYVKSSSPAVEPYWFLMAWSRSKIRPAHKKDGYTILPSRRFCANSLPLIRGFA
jgi:hypothetical protein